MAENSWIKHKRRGIKNSNHHHRANAEQTVVSLSINIPKTEQQLGTIKHTLPGSILHLNSNQYMTTIMNTWNTKPLVRRFIGHNPNINMKNHYFVTYNSVITNIYQHEKLSWQNVYRKPSPKGGLYMILCFFLTYPY